MKLSNETARVYIRGQFAPTLRFGRLTNSVLTWLAHCGKALLHAQ